MGPLYWRFLAFQLFDAAHHHNVYTLNLNLRHLRQVHDLLHRIPRVEVILQYPRHRGEHRQRHLVPSRQLHHRPRRRHPFRHLVHRSQNILQRLPFTQPHADAAVTRQVHETRQHDVARPRQTRERLGPGAHLRRQPSDLCASLRHNAGQRVVPQLQTLDHPRGDGQHVLQRAAHLDPDDVRAGVHAQMRGREQALDPPREIFILRRGDDGGG